MKLQYSRGYMSSLAVFVVMLSLSAVLCILEAVSNEKSISYDRSDYAYAYALALNSCEETRHVLQEQAASHNLWDRMPFIFSRMQGTKFEYTDQVKLSKELLNGGIIQRIEVERFFQDEIRITSTVKYKTAHVVMQGNYKVPYALMGSIICSGNVRTHDKGIVDSPVVFANKYGSAISFKNVCMSVDANRFPKNPFKVFETSQFACDYEIQSVNNEKVLLLDPSQMPASIVRCSGFDSIIIEGNAVSDFLLITDGACIVQHLTVSGDTRFPTAAIVANKVIMNGSGYTSQDDHPEFLLLAKKHIDIGFDQGDFFGVALCGENYLDNTASVDVSNGARIRYALPSEDMLEKMNLGLHLKMIGISDITVL